MKKTVLFAAFLSLLSLSITAQSVVLKTEGQDPQYVETIKGRAQKIVDGLQLADAGKAENVRNIIANRYFLINDIHSKYDKKTQSCDTISVTVKEYDCVWFINAFSSDSRFSVSFISTTPGVEGDPISISKFVMNDQSKPDGFLYSGASFHRLP